MAFTKGKSAALTVDNVRERAEYIGEVWRTNVKIRPKNDWYGIYVHENKGEVWLYLVQGTFITRRTPSQIMTSYGNHPESTVGKIHPLYLQHVERESVPANDINLVF